MDKTGDYVIRMKVVTEYELAVRAETLERALDQSLHAVGYLKPEPGVNYHTEALKMERSWIMGRCDTPPPAQVARMLAARRREQQSQSAGGVETKQEA